MDLITLIMWATIVTLVWGADDSENVKRIWCLDENAKSQENLIKDIKKEDILCKSKAVLEYPWGPPKANTTTRPEQLTIKTHTHKTDSRNSSRQIAVFVSWRQRIAYMEQTEGYHMELNFLMPPGQAKQYLMTWDNNLMAALKDTTAHYVEFNFIYCGTNGNYHIKPGEKYRFRIQGLPLYRQNSSPQAIAKSITIPGCDNREISKSEACLKKPCPNGGRRRRNRCRKNPPQNAPTPAKVIEDEPTPKPGTDETAPTYSLKLKHIMFITAGAFLIFALIVGMIFYAYRRRPFLCFLMKKEGPPPSKRHILIICSAEAKFLKPITKLLTILDRCNHIKLTCNLRQKVHIGECGILKWTTKNVHDADIVVFLVANESDVAPDNDMKLEDIEKHQAVKSLRITESIINTSKCENKHKTFIVVDLHSCVERENLSLFKHYRLLDDFEKFTQHVFGNLYQIGVNEKKIFFDLLSSAQLCCGTIDEEVLYEEVPDPQLNNLNSPQSLGEEEQSLALNIDGPPSYESNQSQEYETTDYNNRRLDRYLQSGARPKVTC